MMVLTDKGAVHKCLQGPLCTTPPTHNLRPTPWHTAARHGTSRRVAARGGASRRLAAPRGANTTALQRRLHGARRARGTSLCPGHILLFGHVKMLILSLLSKSLPIKGREARPAAHPGKCKALNHPEDLWTHCYGRFTRLWSVNTFGHGVSSKTVIRRGGATAVRCRASALVLRTTDRMACRAMPAIARFLSARPSAKPETNRLARLPIHARRAYIERGITLISGRGKA